MRALLGRSRLLADVHFQVPLGVYRDYLRAQAAGDGPGLPAPVASIAEAGRYRLTLDAKGKPALAATVRLRIFQPRRCRSVPVLTARWAWEKVTVNGKPAKLAVRGGWLRFTPTRAGLHVVSATVPLKQADPYGGKLTFDIPETVRTSLRFDSPGRWDVSAVGAAMRLHGSAEGGTHGELSLSPRKRIEVTYTQPLALPPRPPAYQLRGVVAWNIDAGRQQVAARLGIRILGGKSERLDLRLPPAARRVAIVGPDVRETRIAPGGATVFLRGRIGGQTRLDVNYELPVGAGSVKRLQRVEMRDGHWAGGTLVVTNTAGGSEILAHSTNGLREMHPADLPSAARAIQVGKPVLAYEITSRYFSAAIDVVDLGEFALRESIADLAHYQLLFRGDGSVLCKVDYEIRNRSRQFLRVALPRGAQVLLARVNDRARPITPVRGQPGAYLLPLVRSQASVQGLVSFPVQLLVLFGGEALSREGELSLPLPRIDLPIAYGWCELRAPEGLDVRTWSGPLRRVERYSSETAVASLTYGRGELAEGYRLKDRPTVRVAPKPAPKAEPTKPPEPRTEPQPATPATRPAVAQQPPTKGTKVASQILLSRNYYRAGRDFYERGQYDKAAESLRKVLRDFPRSPDAPNVRRLLANIRMVRGDLAARSRQEKALGRQVKKEISGLNVELTEQQQKALERGREASRAGRFGEARAQYKAAQSLGEQLVAQGADVKEQTVLLREATEQLGGLRRQQQAEAAKWRTKYHALKQQKKYGEALEVGKLLQQMADRDQPDLRRELEGLTVQTLQQSVRLAPGQAEKEGTPGSANLAIRPQAGAKGDRTWRRVPVS